MRFALLLDYNVIKLGTSCNMGWGGANKVHLAFLAWECYVVRSSSNFKHPECHVVDLLLHFQTYLQSCVATVVLVFSFMS